MHDVNIANGVRFWSRWSPEKVSIRFENRDITWAAFDEATSRVATGLASLGVEPGDRVGILAGNSVEYCETAQGMQYADLICQIENQLIAIGITAVTVKVHCDMCRQVGIELFSVGRGDQAIKL